MNSEKPPGTHSLIGESALTESERRALRDLLDELVDATEDRVFWFGRARETALELRRRLSALLDTDDE